MSATPIILLLGRLGTDEEDNFTTLDELPEGPVQLDEFPEGPAPLDELPGGPSTFNELCEGSVTFDDLPEGPATAKVLDNPGLSVLSFAKPNH